MVWRVRVLAHALRDARLRVPARELQGVFPAEFSPVAGVCGISQTNTEIWIGKRESHPVFPTDSSSLFFGRHPVCQCAKKQVNYRNSLQLA